MKFEMTNEMIERTIKLFKEEAGNKNIDIIYDKDQHFFSVKGDELSILRLVASNASTHKTKTHHIINRKNNRFEFVFCLAHLFNKESFIINYIEKNI